MKLSCKLYDFMKWFTLIPLPALGTFYYALAAVWGLPFADEVTGTIVALETFLGVILGLSTASYNKTKNQ